MISTYISNFHNVFGKYHDLMPWEITANLPTILSEMMSNLNDEFEIKNGIAIHRSATIESGAVIKAPAIISENCLVAATGYLRGGVYLGRSSIIGPGCEIKTSVFMEKSVAAHLNFVGDSLIGNDVNFEAGSITANHYNERVWKEISVVHDSKIIPTGSTRFGSLIGDHCRIGANAVLFPGSLLLPQTIVDRLQLFNQSSNSPDGISPH